MSMKTVGTKGEIEIGKCLRKGSSSTKVFIGTFKGIAVAVKRVERDDGLDTKKLFHELDILKTFHHPNIISYLYDDLDEEYLYIVLTKCEKALDQVVKSDFQIVPYEPYRIFHHVVDGVDYLHKKNLIHDDLKPSNILFCLSDTQWTVKIADFGISKILPSDTTSCPQTSGKGTLSYMAKERVMSRQLTKESDIFSLGVVFYFILSKGKHPFGSSDEPEVTQTNILNGNDPDLSCIAQECVWDTTRLLQYMLCHDPKNRPSIGEVKAHHIFWNDDKKLGFFEKISDCLENRGKYKDLLDLLEKDTDEKSGKNWLQTLLRDRPEDSAIRISCNRKPGKKRGKQAKKSQASANNAQDQGSVQDLIRKIRNWSHHYHDERTSDKFREEVGELPSGLLELFTANFPNLLPRVYDLMRPLSKTESHLDKFYGKSESLDTEESAFSTVGFEEDNKVLYALPPSPTLEVREYQKELAEQAVDGHNSLVVAPTGSGKTFVAKVIIENHLSSSSARTIIFVVPTTALAKQQWNFFCRHLAGISPQDIEYLVGEKVVDAPVAEVIKSAKITVLTAQILVNELRRKNGCISFADISLIILDECHNVNKGHPYKVIMDMLVDFQHDNPDQQKTQVVGLTASPGIGKGKSADEVMDNLITLLANMNVTLRPSLIVKNADELKRHQNEISEGCIRVNLEEDFSQKVSQVMQKIEDEIKQMGILGNRVDQIQAPPGDRGKQMYENWTVDLMKLASEDRTRSNEIHTYAEHLLMYYNVLFYKKFIPNFMEASKTTANFDQEGEQADRLKSLYRDLEQDAQGVDIPMLTKVLEILENEFKRNPDSRCIIFVPRVLISTMIVKYLNSNEKYSHLGAKSLTGVHDKTAGMTKATMESTIDAFREGECKVVLATSVAEEGLSIESCNLIIMFNYVTGEVGSIQRKGRALHQGQKHATKSRSILVSPANSDLLKREKSNAICAKMTETTLKKLHESSPDDLASRVKRMQDILRRQRRAEAKKRIEEIEMGAKWKILCGKCGTYLSRVDKLREIKEQHKVVVDPDFESHVTYEKDKPKEIYPGIFIVGFYHCIDATCNHELGKRMEINNEVYPVLTPVANLRFDDGNGKVVSKKKSWVKCPFGIRPMEEPEGVEAATVSNIADTETGNLALEESFTVIENAEDLTNEEAWERLGV